MDAIFAITSITGEILGSPSPELRKALESYGVRIFAPFRSM
jgi:hypothetical protein